jgi:outer membrane protein assembly factor BamB
MKNHFNNSVYSADTIYGFDNAILKAVDANTGQTLWRENGFGKGSLILSGSHLLILSETGNLICAKTSRDAFRIEKRIAVMKGRCWTPPSLAGDRLYLRNQNEIVCLTPGL